MEALFEPEHMSIHISIHMRAHMPVHAASHVPVYKSAEGID